MTQMFRGLGRRSVLTLIVSLSACSGSSDGESAASDATTSNVGGGDSGGTTDTSAGGSDYFRARIYRAQCEYNLRCHAIPNALEGECLEYAERSVNSAAEAYDEAAALAAGRIEVDQAKVEACIVSLKSAGCSTGEVGAAFRDCNLAVVGKVEPGGTCFGYSECANGYCERPSSASYGCPGVCRAYVAAGDPCTNNVACPEGTSCRNICVGECKSICFAPAGLGDPCGGEAFCDDGLLCRRDPPAGPPDGTANGLCVAWPAEGAPCTGNDGYVCPRNLICDRNLEVPTCTARHGEGGPCGSHDACADGLFCDGGTYDFMSGKTVIEGKCIVPIQVGGACTPPDPETTPSSACVNFTVCDAVSKTCVLERALAGEECGTATTPAYCVYSYECDNTTHRCVYARGLGESCSPEGAACVNGTACSSGGTCERICE